MREAGKEREMRKAKKPKKRQWEDKGRETERERGRQTDRQTE